MPKVNKQNFLQGIDRRFDREDSLSSDHFFSIQNARLFKRGDAGKISRISGFSKFNDSVTDYSNILDIVSYKNFYVVFYKGDDFGIDVYDVDGNVEFTSTYSADDTDDGKLVISDQSIFVSPHNKILYFNDGEWQLSEYISEAPVITNINTDVESGVSASGNINISSGVAEEGISTNAYGTLTVIRNNVPIGQVDTIVVNVDGNLTNGIEVKYEDGIRTIRDKIVQELLATTAITDDWDIRKTSEEGGSETKDKIYIISKQPGTDFNDKVVAIAESSFTIWERINTNPFNFDLRFWSMFRPDPLFGGIRELIKGGPIFDSLNTTIVTRNTSGGSDQLEGYGKILVDIDFLNSAVFTENLTSSDTYLDIANKISTALNDSSDFSKHYTASVTDNTGDADVEIEANDKGVRYNSGIDLFIVIGTKKYPVNELFSLGVTDISGGSDSNPNIGLEPFQDYWYSVRYRYLDGHLTQTGFPVHVNTGANENIELTIQTEAEDIDGTVPEIEIFRKRETEEFFLIDRVRPISDSTVYEDDGRPIRQPIDQKINVWNKTHQTHDIVDNYYVRANIEYFDESFDWNDDFVLSAVDSDNEKELPKHSKATVYIRPQFSDGSRGFHKEIGVVDVNDYGKKLKINQQALVTNNDRNVVDLGVYANFVPQGQEFIYSFSTPEIINPNIPAIEGESVFSTKTQIFFGFKYVEVRTHFSEVYVRVGAWDSSNREEATASAGRFNESGDIGGKLPRKTTFSFGKIKQDYIRIAVQEDPAASGEYIGIYKLEIYDALTQAISTGDLKLRLKQGQTQASGGRISDRQSRDRISDRPYRNRGVRDINRTAQGPRTTLNRPDRAFSGALGKEDLQNLTVGVSGLIDKSSNYRPIMFNDGGFIQAPYDSRIYLELEESEFDNLENASINQYSLRADYSVMPDLGAQELILFYKNRDLGIRTFSLNSNLQFEFINFRKNSDAEFEAYTSGGGDLDGGRPDQEGGNQYFLYSWNGPIYDLINYDALRTVNELIYLGTKSNEVAESTLDVTGFINPDDDNLNYTFLADYNIYESRIEETDININRQKFPNQLIYTDPVVEGNLYSGGRNIRAENFFNISEENGHIIDIITLGNRLYVFCETGIAEISVGEIVSQQQTGEMFVDTSRVLNNYRWVMDSFHNIKRKSIIRHKQRIYFTDGYDVYVLGQGVENITNGKIPLDSDHEYSAFVNNTHFEYVLCDLTDEVSWVYNFEFGVWYGPYTFVSKKGGNISGQVVSQVGTDLVKHGVGNDFNGTAFTTLIQSVADDTEVSFYDKTYRKYYINSDNDDTAVFKYGKDHTSLVSNGIADMEVRNSYKHQGVSPNEQNSKVLFWEIETNDDGFELKDIAWDYNIKQRR